MSYVPPADGHLPARRCLLDEARQHLVRIEVLLGDGPRRLCVSVIVALDLADRGGGFLDGPEAEDTLTGGQDRSEAGILHDHGSAGSEVARGAAAEPAGLTPDISVLGHAPLRLRRLDVLPVAVEVAADPGRVGHVPVHAAQQVSGGRIGCDLDSY